MLWSIQYSMNHMSDKGSQHVLILSASYGAGHTQAGKALVEHLEAAGHTTVHRDILSFIPAHQADLLRNPYAWLVRFFPRAYGTVYKNLQKPMYITVFKRLYRPFFWLYARRVLRYIEMQQPDTIVCTQFTASELLDYLISKGNDLPPYWVCVTDYAYHPMWKASGAKGYLLAAPEVKQLFSEAEIPASMLHVTGIPVRPVFSKTPKDSMKRTHITIMLGGEGFAAPFDVVRQLTLDYPNTPIYIIAGKNKRLKKAFTRKFKSQPNIHTLGWVNTVEEYMRKSLFVVTKTGGLTTTECLVTNTPLYPIDPIPGQESDNYNFLRNHNLLYPNKNTDQVPVFSVDVLPFL